MPSTPPAGSNVEAHGPNLENLRKQAKSLQRAWRADDADALARVATCFPDAEQLGIQQAQLVVAREYGFGSWTKLLDYVPRLGRFNDAYTFEVSRAFNVSAGRLWRAVSEPEELGGWLFDADFAPRQGSRYAFRTRPAMTGVVGVYLPPQAIRFDSDNEGGSWRFEVRATAPTLPAGAATDAQVTFTVLDHMSPAAVDSFAGGPIRVWVPDVTAGWHELLDALESHLTGRPSATVVDYARLCRFYERALRQLRGSFADTGDV